MEKTGASARQWRGGSVKRRWFVSKGYLVEYFEAAPRVGQAPRPKGAFDLRYVERLQPSDDATAPPLAFEVVVGSGGGGKSRKFTFAAVAPADGGSADAEREAWLRLWTAAAPSSVAAAWRHKRSTALAQEIEGAYAGAQKKVEVRRTSLALHRNPSSQLFGPVVLESARNSGSGAPPGVALSPPSDAAAGADAAAADDDADAAAPIAEPPPTAVEPPPAAVVAGPAAAPPAAASAEAEASAVRIQSRVRGAASRRDVWEVKNEKARLEWITYYLSIGDERARCGCTGTAKTRRARRAAAIPPAAGCRGAACASADAHDFAVQLRRNLRQDTKSSLNSSNSG